jgi:serine/threonine-protein kinase
MSITEQLKVALADRYVIEQELGAGGMATVYLAHDAKHNRKVALKVLRPELAAMIGAERFLQEIEVTANLQHPHILPLHDSGEADSFLYYVMPYVEGETLRAKVDREKQLGIDDAVEITRSVAAALDYAHRKGVIHRDIKPENVLMHDGQPLIADFGIALAVSHAGGSRLTETGLSIGTPHYMSPEQAMGDRELDARSDVYSLGAMLYEMLAGDPPYMGNTAQAIVAKVITEKAPPVTVARDTVPGHVAAAISKALNKLPADRFSTAAQFAEALANPSYTLSAATQSQDGATVGTSGRWKSIAMVLGAAVVVLTGVLGWKLLATSTAPARVVRVSLRFPEGELPRNSPWNPLMTISPDGSNLVYVAGTSGRIQLWLRPLNLLHATPIPGTDGGYGAEFSPDGRAITFMTGAGVTPLKVVSLTGEPPITLTDSARWFNPSWGDDGWVYFTNAKWGLSRVPAVGGAVEVLTEPDSAKEETIHHWPFVLPGGRGVLFTVGHRLITDETKYDIAVLDVETRERRTLLRGTSAKYSDTGHLVFLREDGALLAAPFNPDRRELTGPAVPLLDGFAVKNYGSPDFGLSRSGDLVYASTGGVPGGGQLVWVDREGEEEAVDERWTMQFGPPALSPDGRALAVSLLRDDEQLWVRRMPDGPASKLTFEGTQTYRPAWHPDGRRVAYVSDRDGSAAWSAWEQRADGSSAPVLLVRDDRGVEEVTWSPDGEWLIYRIGGDNGQRDILAIRPERDSVPIALLDSPFEEYSPALSPDNRWLAYVSEESGRPEVYVRPFPNTREGKWQVSTEGGLHPVWAHSGNEVFYRNDAGDMVAVAVRTTPTFALGGQEVLFDGLTYGQLSPYHASYAVGESDRRFLMVKDLGGAEEESVLVLGWHRELVAKFEGQ